MPSGAVTARVDRVVVIESVLTGAEGCGSLLLRQVAALAVAGDEFEEVSCGDLLRNDEHLDRMVALLLLLAPAEVAVVQQEPLLLGDPLIEDREVVAADIEQRVMVGDLFCLRQGGQLLFQQRVGATVNLDDVALDGLHVDLDLVILTTGGAFDLQERAILVHVQLPAAEGALEVENGLAVQRMN